MKNINTQNLMILRDWLTKNISEEQFDMARYLKRKSDKNLIRDLSECDFNYVHDVHDGHDCNTVGCMMGWATFIPELQHEIKTKSFYEYFRLFSENMFGLTIEDLEWDYLFSEEWADHKNNDLASGIHRLDRMISGEITFDRLTQCSEHDPRDVLYGDYGDEIYTLLSAWSDL